jgi:hypothetical protein
MSPHARHVHVSAEKSDTDRLDLERILTVNVSEELPRFPVLDVIKMLDRP